MRAGSKVAFSLGDVICPDFQQILAQITHGVSFSGEVVFLSDRGEEPDYFAVVRVAGIEVPLVVPVGKLQMLDEPHSSQVRREAGERPGIVCPTDSAAPSEPPQRGTL